MAKPVYNTEAISLQDGTDVTLRPLPIGPLRKFMKAWREFENLTNEDEAYDIYINCCGIALSRVEDIKNKFEKPLSADDTLSEDYREYLEDVLDMDTIFKILDVCGGLKLNDPNFLAEAEKIAREQAGTA